MTSQELYRHSGEFHPVLLPVGTVIAAAAAAAAGWIYAYAIFYIPFIYIAFLLTLGFGFALAFSNLHVFRFARVRNETVFQIASLTAVVVGFYMHWAAWVALLIRSWGEQITGLEAAIQPVALWETIWEINSVGAWTLFDVEFTGGLLWLIWAVEAAMIFGVALRIGHGLFVDVPFCEQCESWCKKHNNVARVWQDDGQVVLDALNHRDLEALGTFGRVPSDATEGHWFQCDLEMCPTCGATNTLDVALVVSQPNSKGELKENETSVVQNLLISSEEAQMIRAIGA